MLDNVRQLPRRPRAVPANQIEAQKIATIKRLVTIYANDLIHATDLGAI